MDYGNWSYFFITQVYGHIGFEPGNDNRNATIAAQGQYFQHYLITLYYHSATNNIKHCKKVGYQSSRQLMNVALIFS